MGRRTTADSPPASLFTAPRPTLAFPRPCLANSAKLKNLPGHRGDSMASVRRDYGKRVTMWLDMELVEWMDQHKREKKFPTRKFLFDQVMRTYKNYCELEEVKE